MNFTNYSFTHRAQVFKTLFVYLFLSILGGTSLCRPGCSRTHFGAQIACKDPLSLPLEH